MNPETSTNDFLNSENVEKPKLPSGLNVLTILTIIGSSLFAIITLVMPALYGFMEKMMDKAAESGKDFSAKELQDMAAAREGIALAREHMVPIMIISLVGIALCFVGAIMMRKLKKDGYWIYVAGELLPLIGGLVIMGTKQFNGALSVVLGVGLPVLFVVLYTFQKKHLR